MDFLAWPLNTDGFPARWNCGSGWSDEPFVGWIHIVSDIVTWASYMAIPILMAYFLWKRGEEDVVFPKIYGLFATFILVCGTVHLIEAAIFWAPIYRLSAIVKMATAVVSAFTAFSLIKIAPAAIALPGLAVVKPVGMPVFDTLRTPLKLVLLNLIGNAAKHHDQDRGMIAVEVDESEQCYHFRVLDDGPGIEPRFHDQIFDMFQRLKSRDETEGTGLGLAIVKKMVVSAGGEVELTSDGRGAEFAFTWPKIQSAESGDDSIQERQA